MDIIIELILELIFETSVEASKSNKVPKPIRIFLISLILFFFIGVVALFYLVGILVIKENLIGGIIMLAFATFMLFLAVYRFRKMYIEKKED